MQVLALDGSWQFRQAGSSKWMPATVPGCNYTDLLANGRIEDPYFGDNELKVQWVAGVDWEYQRTVQCDQALLDHDKVYLECDGLDTIATIYVNGRKAAATDNQHIAWRIDVRNMLRAGDNDVRIVFKSPLAYGRRQAARTKTLTVSMGMDAGPHLRKAICQFGWDWGPQIPCSGIWRSIRLRGQNRCRIAQVRILQQHRAGAVRLQVSAGVERWRPGSLTARLTLTSPSGKKQVVQQAVRGKSAELSLAVENPQLWWPNGYGKQPLYDLKVEVLDAAGQVLDTSTRRIGLRTIVVERKNDSIGQSFTFVVNGVRIFAKGANWIPLDIFPSRVTDAHYRHVLASAAAAHMNMIRVWGGGFYENEVFYDLCDELGLLVWQDFMFACAVYPSDAAFIDNVKREVTAAVERLRHRACIALWCGNNELEIGWTEWNWGATCGEKAKQAYIDMFWKLMPKWVNRLDPTRTYWPSSPASLKPLDDPDNPTRGDSHYWKVWHGRLLFHEYRLQLHRFQSEFGFQSLPPFETVKTYSRPEDRNMTAYLMEHHQRCPGGNGLIIYYLTNYFRMPRDFKALCYVSQVLQAEGIRYGVEHWRRNCKTVSGTLYWQLNDEWQGQTWSSIDYFGRWKALHYAAKKFYAPQIISAAEDGTDVPLYVTNDATSSLAGTMSWVLLTLEGKQLGAGRQAVAVGPQRTAKVAHLKLADVVTPDRQRNVVLAFELRDRRGNLLSSNLVTFVPTKHMDLADPQLAWKLSTAGDQWVLTVKARRLARFVEIGVKGRDVVFSDNFFDVLPGREQAITFPRLAGETLDRMRRRISVTSLWDSF